MQSWTDTYISVDPPLESLRSSFRVLDGSRPLRSNESGVTLIFGINLSPVTHREHASTGLVLFLRSAAAETEEEDNPPKKNRSVGSLIPAGGGMASLALSGERGGSSSRVSCNTCSFSVTLPVLSSLNPHPCLTCLPVRKKFLPFDGTLHAQKVKLKDWMEWGACQTR